MADSAAPRAEAHAFRAVSALRCVAALSTPV